ncbi:MAG: site-specific DNA-methyltransferase [Oscillospiraceae bacterium]
MTNHKVITGNSNSLAAVADKSIQLIVTSPPYPMIGMWDDLFVSQDSSIAADLENGDSQNAFNKMHDILNSVWLECDRVLADNGFICINIGDATRTVDKQFQLFSNHTAVINYFVSKGYCLLPDIHWRKQSNSPNKFMGSGMYPAGAYVTYEHEYILVFRKGGKRVFSGSNRLLRQESAYFWEERNIWFSDLWEIKGASQFISKSVASRNRSASFPFEIPYRLINMYSAKYDTVLDPFGGLGTTGFASMVSQRNSISVDIDSDISALSLLSLNVSPDKINDIIAKRISAHESFIADLDDDKKQKCYINLPHGFLVKTLQETALHIQKVKTVRLSDGIIICDYL